MRKLVLDPESVSVQSFPTQDAGATARGTVQGREMMGTEALKCPTSISGCVTYCTCPNTQEI